MAQVTDDELSVPPQLTESTNYRRPQVRFGILPHGRHEHNLIHIRTEATITDTLRTLISEKWKKRQGQRSEEVGGITTVRQKPADHEIQGRARRI
jgi:protein-serine/threonine kinase